VPVFKGVFDYCRLLSPIGDTLAREAPSVPIGVWGSEIDEITEKGETGNE